MFEPCPTDVGEHEIPLSSAWRRTTMRDREPSRWEWAPYLLGAGDRYEESVTTIHCDSICGSFDRCHRAAETIGAAGASAKAAAARWISAGAVGEGFEFYRERDID